MYIWLFSWRKNQFCYIILTSVKFIRFVTDCQLEKVHLFNEIPVIGYIKLTGWLPLSMNRGALVCMYIICIDKAVQRQNWKFSRLRSRWWRLFALKLRLVQKMRFLLQYLDFRIIFWTLKYFLKLIVIVSFFKTNSLPLQVHVNLDLIS